MMKRLMINNNLIKIKIFNKVKLNKQRHQSGNILVEKMVHHVGQNA